MSNTQDKPYVFVSYAHANSDRVLPIIRAMQQSGISIWFDEGIVAGSEWPEYIADKVVGCHKFILFISNSYLDSQNCKRELNFAISRKKNILSIFLEDVNLSPGMEMQLGTYQSLYTKRFASDTAFCESLCKEPFFNDCMGDDVEVTVPEQPKEPSPAMDFKTGRPYSNPTPSSNTGSSYSAPQNNNTQSQSTPQPPYSSYRPPVIINSGKSKLVAALLAFFLGAFGANFFYLGNKKLGVLCILLCWTYIPTFIGIINAVRYLVMDDVIFHTRYLGK